MTVANTGSRTGKEVVQVYATDDRSSVVTPNQELIGFAKVEIPYVLSRFYRCTLLMGTQCWPIQESDNRYQGAGSQLVD